MKETESLGSISLIHQGEYTFYAATMPTDILAQTCFVVQRDEDPELGFQRELDEKRAAEIADYIDNGFGTIPCSIILSAQASAELNYNPRAKTLTFKTDIKAFLIIDGQHRVFGFKKAKTALRVPVVIYHGLSRKDETRLFIDINSKQRGVSPALLLDIKRLAETETEREEYFREMFDLFATQRGSALYKKTSASRSERGKVSRPLFNESMRAVHSIFDERDPSESYNIINNYLHAISETLLAKVKNVDLITNRTVFKAIIAFLPKVASRARDIYGRDYSIDNFTVVLQSATERVQRTKLVTPGKSYTALLEHLESAFEKNFVL